MTDFHESTIALSLYNIVAIGQASTISEARRGMAQHGMLVSEEELLRAANELSHRKLMIVSDDRLAVRGPSDHIVVSRDRSGDGWSGWQIAPFNRAKTQSLEGARIR